MFWLYFFFLIFSTCCVLTGVVRHCALAKQRLDVPNHRSSHTVPTARGGGIAFVICFLGASVFLTYLHMLPFFIAITLIGASGGVALIGFLDDRKWLPLRWRLSGHFIISGFALYVLGGFPSIVFFHWVLSPGFVANILGLFYLVWLLNLYNFMDGIDGLAAVEALSVCLGGLVLYALQGILPAMVLPATLACAVGGFLVWNFPKARIFMGDVGSGFLGMTLGIMSIYATISNINFFWSWLVLLGVFIVDSTVTLLRRGLHGENIFQSHRSHAYQYASRHYKKHCPVTLGVLAINLLWLLPMAVIISFDFINGAFGLLIAYLPLIVLAFKFNAGKKELGPVNIHFLEGKN